ncbi:aminopeptidase P N-terminal domain-containing protein [Hymenobacter sp. BT175]|uniref:aminopeptidase P N-terminal domain-containing protein n=1 Tax=Hymenobacter translucens TaxID=2886507 RepID=UPI001D0F41F6|nr:aminopeptidase P N-terminal domain-containing protein [Hymenobacter translucens]MCC2546905.1 aminopeptidase P N-terminal domain-containing protein [Hymenobacter translucens]
MRYGSISPDLFTQNRRRFVQQLPPASLAIFQSNDVMPTNADGTMAFRQNNDLFYLSGVDQEESILVLFPDAKLPQYREILFLKETSEHILVWEGYKLTKEEARAQSGVPTIMWLDSFKTVLPALMNEAENVFLNTNEHIRAVVEVETRDARFGKWLREAYPLHNYRRAAPILHHLRAIKSDEEIRLMREAANITEKAFRRLLGFVKPGVWEYEIEAELLHEFVRNRSRGPAYGSIIASGASACILHYVSNDRQCQDGDVLLLDFGAEFANYAADLSRSLPVNGKFTKRQRDVYEAVLRVMKFATAQLVPGNNIEDYHAAVGRQMEQELIRLDLLNASDVKNQDPAAPLYKKYFMHGTSHYLGLDVHDVGAKYRTFEAGMVYTCEPGIYIREEGLGIRLENDILITTGKPEDLMKNIPLEADDIERLMSSRA